YGAGVAGSQATCASSRQPDSTSRPAAASKTQLNAWASDRVIQNRQGFAKYSVSPANCIATERLKLGKPNLRKKNSKIQGTSAKENAPPSPSNKLRPSAWRFALAHMPHARPAKSVLSSTSTVRQTPPAVPPPAGSATARIGN